MSLFDKPLFIFEMANNHQGSIEHGLRIINELNNVCKQYKDYFDFAVKFQYRDLDTFIHPQYKDSNLKNVKRFRETRLSAEQFSALKNAVKDVGFYAICTPFDEISVDLVAEHNYDVIKIASCSFTDWSLLTKISSVNKPVIASAAGTSLEDIRRVVMFFKNRAINFSLLHCVAEYPVADTDLQLNQIDLFRKEFPNLTVGFSTHESPDNTEAVKLAVAKGAKIFEKHVGVATDEITLNAYSATPKQAGMWIDAAKKAFDMCGTAEGRYISNKKEIDDLSALKRGVFANSEIVSGEKISLQNTFLAFPCQTGQLLSENISKYTSIVLKNTIQKDAPIMLKDVEIKDDSDIVRNIVKQVVKLLNMSNVVVPTGSTCEISHHYGLEQSDKTGVTIITCINREYCKKLLCVLPGQSNPEHMHKIREETFTVLYGDLTLVCDGVVKNMKKGETVTVSRGVKNSFFSETGCVFEEISTTHRKADSFYSNENGFVCPRKTKVYLTEDILKEYAEL